MPPGFDLITTYEELAKYTVAFAKGGFRFLLLIGPPGVGKSKQAEADVSGTNCVFIDTHVTLMELYCDVFDADNSPIVLDDINHLFQTKQACSVLKSLTKTVHEKVIRSVLSKM